MTDELKNKLTERFEFLAKRSKEQVSADIYDALLKAYLAGGEYGYQYAQEHPAWVSVEKELPPHRNQTNHKFENDFSVNCFVSDGKDVDTGYYDYRLRKWNCEFLTDVVYWYCPQPPRKEARNEND